MRLPTSATYQLFQSALQQVNQSIDDLHVILEVDNVSTIKDLIIQNAGMDILPQGLCKDEIRQGLLQPLAITGLKMLRQTSLVFLDDFSYRHILEDIVNILNQR